MVRKSLDAIAADFHAAIDRLMAGTPTNPALMKRAERKCLAINSATVAAEAGHSRTLISLADCRLPDVRDRLSELLRPTARRNVSGVSAKNARLQKEVLELRRALEASLGAQAESFLARERAEREASKWRAALSRVEGQMRVEAVPSIGRSDARFDREGHSSS